MTIAGYDHRIIIPRAATPASSFSSLPPEHENKAVFFVNSVLPLSRVVSNMEKEDIKDIGDVSMEEDSNNNNLLQHRTTPEQSSKKNKRVETEIICGTSDKSLPSIRYFQNGDNPEKRQRGEEPKVRVLRNMKCHKWTLTNNRFSQMNFISANCSGEAAAPQVSSYALRVLGKQSQTLEIVQIEATKMYRLEPNFGDQGNTADGTSKEVEDYETFDDLEEKCNLMVMKYELAAEKAQEDLNKMMADASARNIPPHDMSATTPQQAYPIEKIINRREWRYLLDIIGRLHERKNILPDRYPVFVCNRIHKMEEAKDRKAKDLLGSVLSYINHLIKFKDKHSMDDFGSAKDHIFPGIFTQKFNDMFADQGSKRLADDKRDLLISYVLVLTLFVDDFKTEFTDIAKDLRMPSGDLRRHYELLGCKFVRENNVMLATLPAPLKFLKVR